MHQLIIYPTDAGITEIFPTGALSIEDTALKDVPTGVVFKIINISDLPSDLTFRDAWEYDFTDSFDGVGE